MSAPLIILALSLLALAAVSAVKVAGWMLSAPHAGLLPMTAALVVRVAEPGPLSRGSQVGRATALIHSLAPTARVSIGSGGLQVLLDGVDAGEAHQVAWQFFYALESDDIAARIGVAVRRPGESVAQCGLRAAIQTRSLPLQPARGVSTDAPAIALVA